MQRTIRLVQRSAPLSERSAVKKVGWIRLGKMGLPLRQHLQGAGFEVKAFCRSAEKQSLAAAVARELGDRFFLRAYSGRRVAPRFRGKVVRSNAQNEKNFCNGR